MARRRCVFFPTMSGATVSFLVRDAPKEKTGMSENAIKLKPIIAGLNKRRARLKREIVNNVLRKIYHEENLRKIPELDLADMGYREIRRAARLAIELWEKRR